MMFVVLYSVNNFICDRVLLDSFIAQRADEVQQLSAMLSSTSSLVRHDLDDIDAAQQSAGHQLVTGLDQLLDHCSQTKVVSCFNDSL